MKHQRPIIVSLAVTLLAADAPLLRSQSSVTITGLVRDAATNTPIAGARVTSTSSAAPGAAPSVFRTKSLGDGTLALAVVGGKHAICVDAGRPYLDPCRWPENNIFVNTAQSLSLDIPLTKGVLLTVIISDPAGAAQAARQASPSLAKVPAPPVSVMLQPATGSPIPVPFAASSSSGSEFSLLVPPSAPFTLKVSSAMLALTDASGKALPSNTLTTELISPSASAIPQPMWMFRSPVRSQIPSTVISLSIRGLL